jgi:NADH-quinone oxidoreductase subunit J
MTTILYLSAAIAVAATVLAVTRLNAVHALLLLVVSLLATALVFFVLGAPFAAALEVVVYAGAIMVFFIFVVMTLDMGPTAAVQEQLWRRPSLWVLPGLLAAALLVEFLYVVLAMPGADGQAGVPAPPAGAVAPQQVGLALFGQYSLGVELASFVLLAGLVGAFHLGRRHREQAAAEGGE